jgi:hypothetical protein
MAEEALEILEVPKKLAAVLLGHGWRPPEEDVVKINTDGVLSLVTRKGGAGGVAISHSSYLGAWSKPYDGISDSLIAETLALRDCVIFAKLRGFPRW